MASFDHLVTKTRDDDMPTLLYSLKSPTSVAPLTMFSQRKPTIINEPSKVSSDMIFGD